MSLSLTITQPRTIAPGFVWFSSCLPIRIAGGDYVHNHNACFLLMGSKASVLIDTCMPAAWATMREPLEQALGGRPLDYVFPTHPEMPHMGNVGPLLDTYPDLTVVGDLRGYDLFFPGQEARLRNMGPGEELELGDRRLRLIAAPLHDLPNTLWAYEPEARILFMSDAYPFTHEHEAGQCLLLAEEMPRPPQPSDTRLVLERALSWTRHVPAEVAIAALDAFLAEHPVDIIAPAHGGVITNPANMTRVFRDGLRAIRATA
jgi:flavorubredoxin